MAAAADVVVVAAAARGDYSCLYSAAAWGSAVATYDEAACAVVSSIGRGGHTDGGAAVVAVAYAGWG